jgi:hypothetical protein
LISSRPAPIDLHYCLSRHWPTTETIPNPFRPSSWLARPSLPSLLDPLGLLGPMGPEGVSIWNSLPRRVWTALRRLHRPFQGLGDRFVNGPCGHCPGPFPALNRRENGTPLRLPVLSKFPRHSDSTRMHSFRYPHYLTLTTRRLICGTQHTILISARGLSVVSKKTQTQTSTSTTPEFDPTDRTTTVTPPSPLFRGATSLFRGNTPTPPATTFMPSHIPNP